MENPYNEISKQFKTSEYIDSGGASIDSFGDMDNFHADSNFFSELVLNGMDYIEVIGICAGVFTTTAAVPQIVKAWKSKKVEDVSPWMFCVLILGVVLWTIYGILKMDWPIIVTNGISAFLNLTMLLLIIRFRE